MAKFSTSFESHHPAPHRQGMLPPVLQLTVQQVISSAPEFQA